jgi:L-lactate dehydrogenase complex protein LldG
VKPLQTSAFLGTVRAALGHRPDVRRTPPADLFPDAPSAQSRHLLARIQNRSRAERATLLETLQTAAAPINLKVFSADSMAAARQIIVDAATQNPPEWGRTKQVCAWRHPLIDSLDIGPALQDCGMTVVIPPAGEDMASDGRATFARAVRDSFIGVTAADYCVADSATLVLRTRPGQPRSVSLVPSIHVAVIRDEQILSDFKELYAVLRWRDQQGAVDLSTCMTFISGPSKTADIEATLVHGAHGPRELHLIVLPTRNAGSD